MPRSSTYIISYDIENNKERRQVSKVLEGFGTRRQKSVFECPLTRSGRNKLEERLTDLELVSGFILIYHLDNRSKRKAIGQVPADIARPSTHSFIV